MWEGGIEHWWSHTQVITLCDSRRAVGQTVRLVISVVNCPVIVPVMVTCIWECHFSKWPWVLWALQICNVKKAHADSWECKQQSPYNGRHWYTRERTRFTNLNPCTPILIKVVSKCSSRKLVEVFQKYRGTKCLLISTSSKGDILEDK